VAAAPIPLPRLIDFDSVVILKSHICRRYHALAIPRAAVSGLHGAPGEASGHTYVLAASNQAAFGIFDVSHAQCPRWALSKSASDGIMEYWEPSTARDRKPFMKTKPLIAALAAALPRERRVKLWKTPVSPEFTAEPGRDLTNARD